MKYAGKWIAGFLLMVLLVAELLPMPVFAASINPPTGDHSLIGAWIAVLALCVAALILIFVKFLIKKP